MRDGEERVTALLFEPVKVCHHGDPKEGLSEVGQNSKLKMALGVWLRCIHEWKCNSPLIAGGVHLGKLNVKGVQVQWALQAEGTRNLSCWQGNAGEHLEREAWKLGESWGNREVAMPGRSPRDAQPCLECEWRGSILARSTLSWAGFSHLCLLWSHSSEGVSQF